MTLEDFIASINHDNSTVQFTALRYNPLNENYTLAIDIDTHMTVSQVEFFDGKTIQEAIEQFNRYLSEKVQFERDKMEELKEEELDNIL